MSWLRDPLVQFFALGALLLLGYATLGGLFADGDNLIEVGDSNVQLLAANFERQWRRAPTESELRALIDAQVREEVLYREALALGLDTDDVVVRRRMAQKMELLSQDLVLMTDPTDEELRQYLAENADEYRMPDRMTFEQVYFSVDARGAAAEPDAQALVDALRAGSVDVAALEDFGDASMIPTQFFDAPPMEVARVFGDTFSSMIFALDEGVHGPMLSPFGVHVVSVARRTPGGEAPFDAIRGDLIRDFNLQRTEDAKRRLYDGLLERYEVTIDDDAILRATLDAQRPAGQ